MTSRQFKRWPAAQGRTFGAQSGSHLKVYLGDKQSVIPMHGGSRQLRKGLTIAIKKQLGLE